MSHAFSIVLAIEPRTPPPRFHESSSGCSPHFNRPRSFVRRFFRDKSISDAVTDMCVCDVRTVAHGVGDMLSRDDEKNPCCDILWPNCGRFIIAFALSVPAIGWHKTGKIFSFWLKSVEVDHKHIVIVPRVWNEKGKNGFSCCYYVEWHFGFEYHLLSRAISVAHFTSFQLFHIFLFHFQFIFWWFQRTNVLIVAQWQQTTTLNSITHQTMAHRANSQHNCESHSLNCGGKGGRTTWSGVVETTISNTNK